MNRMGLAPRAELASRYAQCSGLDLSRIAWYHAFALWKAATVVQQLHHRWVVGDSTDPRMQTIADGVPRLVEGAGTLLRGIGA
jgi:aminoglycoside phosphotransferase (APT) family kinase protein